MSDDENESAPLSNTFERPAGPPYPLPRLEGTPKYAVAPELMKGGAPIVFDVHGTGGWRSRDHIVTGLKGSPIYYFLSFLGSLKGWSMTLHRGDSTSNDVVLTMSCKPLKRADFRIKMLPTGWTTKLEKPSGSPLVSTALEFRGFEGTKTYVWTNDAGWKSDVRWTCMEEESGATVATWKRSPFGRTKHGSVLINAAYSEEAELILGTAIALEEWRREKRKG